MLPPEKVQPADAIILRRMSPDDLDDLLAFQTHPENLALQPVEPFSREGAEEYLIRQSGLDFETAEGWVSFAIALKEDNRMIGEAGIYLSAPDASQGDVGWSIHPDQKRKGYGQSAARLLLKYAFEQRNLHRVTGTCDARNLASCRLMEKTGMRLEGSFRQSKQIHGKWEDERQYALLRSEWQAAA